MKKIRKVLGIILVVALCLSFGAINAFADTPVTVISITPDTTIKVDTNAVIAIAFSNNIGSNASTNKDLIVLEKADGTVVPYKLHFNTDDSYNKYVFVEPIGGLVAQTDYKLTIKKNITANSGEKTETKLEYTFTTRNKAEATNEKYNAAVTAGVTFTSYEFNNGGTGTTAAPDVLNFIGAYVLNNKKDTYKEISTVTSGVPTDIAIALVFDGNMGSNAENNAKYILLKDKDGNKVPTHLYFYDKNSGTMSPDATGENKAQRVIYLVPETPLAANGVYSIELQDGITSGQSSKVLANPGTVSFKTNAETGYSDPNFVALKAISVIPEIATTTAPSTTAGTTTVEPEKKNDVNTNDGSEVAIVISGIVLAAGAVYVTDKSRKE